MSDDIVYGITRRSALRRLLGLAAMGAGLVASLVLLVQALR